MSRLLVGVGVIAVALAQVVGYVVGLDAPYYSPLGDLVLLIVVFGQVAVLGLVTVFAMEHMLRDRFGGHLAVAAALLALAHAVSVALLAGPDWRDWLTLTTFVGGRAGMIGFHAVALVVTLVAAVQLRRSTDRASRSVLRGEGPV